MSRIMKVDFGFIFSDYPLNFTYFSDSQNVLFTIPDIIFLLKRSFPETFLIILLILFESELDHCFIC